MKLHNDKDAFILLLTQISERTGIRADILEKDYYVTLMLEELSRKQQTVPAYFKGGTALYKALGTIRRFSEDIDLTVKIRDCSNTQAKKRLENVSKRYSVPERTADKSLETDKKGNITAMPSFL
ncbi:MAG: nucleotidyl transferase AbiEii/AbiGii toxin family protein [Ruminococcus sp.]|nr:nucleotidyl transferase AbiEii/AbiGii toxin family protein [Ruminococcus sp.]